MSRDPGTCLRPCSTGSRRPICPCMPRSCRAAGAVSDTGTATRDGPASPGIVPRRAGDCISGRAAAAAGLRGLPLARTPPGLIFWTMSRDTCEHTAPGAWAGRCSRWACTGTDTGTARTPLIGFPTAGPADSPCATTGQKRRWMRVEGQSPYLTGTGFGENATSRLKKNRGCVAEQGRTPLKYCLLVLVNA